MDICEHCVAGHISQLSSSYYLKEKEVKDKIVSELESKWGPSCNLSREKYLSLLRKALSQMGIWEYLSPR